MYSRTPPAPMRPRQMTLWWAATALLGLASVVPSSLGAAFALISVTGLSGLAFCQQHSRPPVWLRYWLFTCVAALALRAIAVTYWHDSWSERHAELKLLVGALSALGLWKCLPANRSQIIQLISNSLTLTLTLALLWVWKEGRWSLVTHPVPWAHVMGFMVSWLIAVSADKQYAPQLRLLWWMGGLAGLTAVLVSQSRGAYAIVPWWLAVMAWQTWQTLRAPQAQTSDKRMLLVSGLLLTTVLATSLLPSVRQTLHERVLGHLQTAVTEVVHSNQSAAAGSNSSVGARLYMWQRSLSAIAQSPWIGYGRNTRLALIQSWAQEADSTEVRRLGHVHNEYLHALIDHGLLGLGSLLLLMGTLTTLVWRFHRLGQTTSALALAGTVLVWMTGEISSVSFAHNFFTAGLALMLTLILAVLPEQKNAQPSAQ